MKDLEIGKTDHQGIPSTASFSITSAFQGPRVVYNSVSSRKLLPMQILVHRSVSELSGGMLLITDS